MDFAFWTKSYKIGFPSLAASAWKKNWVRYGGVPSVLRVPAPTPLRRFRMVCRLLRVPAPAPRRRRRLRRFGTRSATAPSLIFLAPRRSVFISMNSLHWRLGLLHTMEKELDEVFGGGRLLRVPAPVLLPLRCARVYYC